MTTPVAPTVERVVLVDEDGNAIGSAPKDAVHSHATPLHLAFSCYLFDADGSVLVTRRALDKPTFPGVWTNSCCGHPAPGEPAEEAVRRRVRQELGLEVAELRLLLPAFRYRAVMVNGVVEHELCPVFAGTASGELRADPAEVEEVRWEPWPAFRRTVLDGTREVSLWCRLQVEALPADPLTAPSRPSDDLPPAAR